VPAAATGEPMSLLQEGVPALNNDACPPTIRGIADLTTLAYHGHTFDQLLDRISHSDSEAGALLDLSIALQLDFRPEEGRRLQAEALHRSTLYRVRPEQPSPHALRLLALVGPGDLMANTPLDFLTNHLDVRLDLLHVIPGEPLPSVIPDHDVAFFAYGDPDPDTLARLTRLYRLWPRPALNDPRFLPALARDTLSRSLRGIPGICSPVAVALPRAALEAWLNDGTPIDGFESPDTMFPCLIRPAGSHAGHGLYKAADRDTLAGYLLTTLVDDFTVSSFVDYSDSDGMFRKSRVAFIDRQPFLCHMAISRHWMVHYLNAGMDSSPEKRVEEGFAMRTFDYGFARRHAAAFDALHERLGFDFYSIDCAETRDGRLLVFEADAAAIIHMMDPVETFPYKHPQMRRVFDSFGAMLQRRIPVLA
jgi:hypothetical protein